jgi:peptidylprolyl isomerase
METMKKQIQIFSVVGMLAISSLFAEEKQKTETAAQTSQSMDIAKISEAFGHVISKNLENIGVKFEMAKVIQGLQDATDGKTAPMSEMECIQAISAVQEKIFKEQCTENLKKAESFLSDNAKAAGIVALDEGKVQYRIMEAGNGAAVESHFSPLIKYTGKYLDGSVFGASKEEELISLDEVIPGLKAGLLGMREGEKRTVYIHPDLAYGTNGYLPPNSLLTFEVEIVKANAPAQEAADSDAEKPQAHPEIADIKTDIR